MRLLIDGYNLLHVTDLFGSGPQAGTLEGSREALLTVLVARLPAKLRRAATIVFDAAQAPPGLPDCYERQGLSVRFARGLPDADALLEIIVEQHAAPKSLLVVSSDHRVQRAARQRGAAFIDSRDWYRELTRQHSRPASGSETSPARTGDSTDWKREFNEYVAQDAALAVDLSPASDYSRPDPPSTTQADAASGDNEGAASPFPPGYADELLDQWHQDS